MVFLLHAEVGFTIGMVAECVGISREIVKTRLRYAIAFLNSSIDIVDGEKRPDFLQIYRQIAEINPTIMLSHYVISEALFETAHPERVEPKRKCLIKRASSMTSTLVNSLKKLVA
jgi:hypothetical protein